MQVLKFNDRQIKYIWKMSVPVCNLGIGLWVINLPQNGTLYFSFYFHFILQWAIYNECGKEWRIVCSHNVGRIIVYFWWSKQNKCEKVAKIAVCFCIKMTLNHLERFCKFNSQLDLVNSLVVYIWVAFICSLHRLKILRKKNTRAAAVFNLLQVPDLASLGNGLWLRFLVVYQPFP